MEFRADQPVTVLARVRAFVLCDQIKTFFCNRTHGFYVLIQLEVQDWTYMQAPDRGVRVPCSACAITLKNLGETLGVGGKVGQLNGAVFDKRHGLAVAFHGHHDVEA